MLKEFFDTIEKQMMSKFTGKFNLLSKKSNQFLGQLHLYNGLLIYSTFKNLKGLRSFYSICYEYSLGNLNLVLEAEIIDDSIKNIHFPFSVLKKKSEFIIETFQKNKGKAPPKSINLMIDPAFVDSEVNINQDEFETLLEIKKYPNIGELFEKSYFTEQELTNNLVSLRKKETVKVYK